MRLIVAAMRSLKPIPDISDRLDGGVALWLGLDLAPKCIDTPIAELNEQLACVEMRPFDPEVAAVVEAAGPPGAIYPCPSRKLHPSDPLWFGPHITFILLVGIDWQCPLRR